MEEIKLTIKKPYAKEVIADLEKMDAIIIEKVDKINPADLVGSWSKEPIEKINENIEKIRAEWR